MAIPDGWFQVSSVRGGGIQAPDNSWNEPPLARLRGWTVENLYADPCRGVLREPAIGPAVDDLALGLSSIPGVVVHEFPDVRLDGYRAKAMQVIVDSLPDGCDGASVWRSPLAHGEQFSYVIYGIALGHVNRVWIVDMDGKRFVIVAEHGPYAPSGVVTELTEMVESIELEP